jgi:cellulose synthase/poly-beta-1,6-N-acetylglucosamine synthase-like glycosyltransferase
MYSLSDVSIIIPCITLDTLTRKCISVIKELYPDSDVIVLADYNNNLQNIGDINLQITGQVTISAKRNMGVMLSNKKIMAFIDSDAYPKKEWLESALNGFNRNLNLSCITGPNISPIISPYWEHCIGIALSSFLVTLNG